MIPKYQDKIDVYINNYERWPTKANAFFPLKSVGMSKEIEPMVGGEELRRIYPVSERTLSRWVKRGCPSRKVDGLRLYTPSAVEKWLQQFDEGYWP